MNSRPFTDQLTAESTIFGQQTYLPIDFAHALNDNVLVIGSSGTGKTHSFVKPNILQMNMNFVVADAKGEILADTGATLKKAGYDIRVLNLVDLKHSMTYNPLSHLYDDLDLTAFADSIITSTNHGERSFSREDPFWVNAPKELLEALIAFVQEFYPSEQQNMNAVISLFNRLNERTKPLDESETDFDDFKSTIGYQLFDWARQQNPQSYAVRKWDAITSVATSSHTWASVLGILGAAIAPYGMRDVINLMCTDSLNFATLLKPKTALFVMYDDADASKNFISNIFYKQLFAYLYHKSREYDQQKLPVKIRFFLDDFKNVNIPGFDDYLATARSRNLSVCMMLQDESQLRAKFGVNASSVIGNCATYLFTGTSDVKMARDASDRCFILSDDVLRMPRDEFLVNYQGYTQRVKRYDFHTHPNFVDRIYQLQDKIKVENYMNDNSVSNFLDQLVDKVTTNPFTKNEFHSLLINKQIDLSQIRESFCIFDDSNVYPYLGNLLTQMFKTTGYRLAYRMSLASLIDEQLASSYQRKLDHQLMVDFVILGKGYEPLVAINLDDEQSLLNKQQVNFNEYINRAFQRGSIPLLRLAADQKFIRQQRYHIAKKIQELTTKKQQWDDSSMPLVQLYKPDWNLNLVKTAHMLSDQQLVEQF